MHPESMGIPLIIFGILELTAVKVGILKIAQPWTERTKVGKRMMQTLMVAVGIASLGVGLVLVVWEMVLA